ncbi:hypothetical protein [Cytobacillus gottheilii]|uniref:hypothetical protein n=1 Tax=Cytobacillus gottheilii TaxID=859144 RepID=UPI00083425F6|nr:hypothetical protein [Cytobacillus gottheilii]
MDLNTLISTIITSTAALVAIIGGFLVSRVISISSEQNSIKRRIREINNDIMAKQEISKGIEDYLFEDDLGDFVTRKNIKRIFNGLTLDETIEEDDFTRLTKEEIEPYFNQIKEMIDELEHKLISSENTYNSFKEFHKDNEELKYPNRKDWYEKIFKVIDDSLRQQSINGVFGIGVSLPKYDSLDVDFASLTPNHNYGYYVKEHEKIEDEIKVLELQKKAQQDLLNNFGKPAWIWSGIAVLIYASIVGIVYPSVLLPYPLDTYNDSLTKWFLLSLFYSQLFALFAYLSFAMYKITHSSKI